MSPRTPSPGLPQLDAQGYGGARLHLRQPQAKGGADRHRAHGQRLERSKAPLLGSGAYIWNNDGDTTKLKKKNGRLADKCKCGDGGGTINC
jgi:hypothetical protein